MTLTIDASGHMKACLDVGVDTKGLVGCALHIYMGRANLNKTALRTRGSDRRPTPGISWSLIEARL